MKIDFNSYKFAKCKIKLEAWIFSHFQPFTLEIETSVMVETFETFCNELTCNKMYLKVTCFQTCDKYTTNSNMIVLHLNKSTQKIDLEFWAHSLLFYCFWAYPH